MQVSNMGKAGTCHRSALNMWTQLEVWEYLFPSLDELFNDVDVVKRFLSRRSIFLNCRFDEMLEHSLIGNSVKLCLRCNLCSCYTTLIKIIFSFVKTYLK